jgi:amidohydrolase
VVSRQVDITRNPQWCRWAHQGRRAQQHHPDSVEMIGTIRTFEAAQYQQVTEAMNAIVGEDREANGTTGDVHAGSVQQPGHLQQPDLTARVLPSLRKVAAMPTSRRSR